MGLWQIVLLTAIAILVRADPLLAVVDTDDTQVASPKSSPLAPTSISGADVGKRSLRVGKAVEDGGVNDSTLEERTGGVLSKVSSVFDTFQSKSSLVEQWVMADKSKKSVMKKLKLNGLADNALKSNKNYVFFENFVKMKEIRETNRVNTWLEKNVPTYDVWKTLGLGRVRTVNDLGKIADTDAYKLYMRYVYAFDGRANTNFIQNNVAPSVISSETSWAEKLSRTANWVATDRSDKYVKAALGLDNLPLDGQQVSTNYQFYLYFKLSTLRVQQDVAEKTINFYLKHAPRYVKLTREARKRKNNLQAYLHLDIVAKHSKLMREELN